MDRTDWEEGMSGEALLILPRPDGGPVQAALFAKGR